MNKPVLIYCYDAWCGWCYGFSPVINKIATVFKNQLDIEVLSGGMIINDKPKHISLTSDYINQAYKRVEEHTGIQFGNEFLWHIHNPDLSDWYPSSEKPAIALCIFKELFPDRQVEFAAQLQLALFNEGRDLDDNEAYRHLLENFNMDAELFFTKLKLPQYKEQAAAEFELCKQLQVKAFPVVLLQASDTKFHLLTRGYTSFDELSATINNTLVML